MLGLRLPFSTVLMDCLLAGRACSEDNIGALPLLAIEVCYVAMMDKEQCKHLLLDTQQVRANGVLHEDDIDDALRGLLSTEQTEALLCLCASFAAICTQACNHTLDWHSLVVMHTPAVPRHHPLDQTMLYAVCHSKRA